ncbi:Hypothetical protein NTJ_09733 [Nesidiocoris tenuis]|uniref:Uncharacterized protein n=1 Tax=Nesidiocoris tenuis TaxID=355587 RepID=A0ABN7AXL4_9HEMI|nr:Hypothetical protein NTJ_09733 [Nesidiocoris tenuis]
MYAAVVLFAMIGCSMAAPSVILAVAAPDDGQWKPALDGSVWGSGAIQWGLEDGSWKPALDGSVLGRGDLTWLNRRKRSLAVVNPNALNVPLDTANVALAKNAQLIQQATEGARNVLGGGIPVSLPADTLEVAIGKQAHAIAHATEAARNAGVIASPIAVAPGAIAVGPAAIATSRWIAPAAIAGPIGIAGLHTTIIG